MPTASERVQLYRFEAQQLRERAQSMISEEPRRDTEWMANRYEALATTIEQQDEFARAKFPDAS